MPRRAPSTGGTRATVATSAPTSAAWLHEYVQLRR